MTVTRKMVLLLGALAIVAAACGGGDEAEADPTTTLPPIAGACEVGVPDCNDTVDPTADPGTGSSVSSGAVLVDGGLTIEEALQTDATGVIAVKGFVVADGAAARLCGALAESLPPQCGGATLTIDGLDDAGIELKTAQGISWTDQQVTIIGELAGDTLTVFINAAG